jgi:hypothetical protein
MSQTEITYHCPQCSRDSKLATITKDYQPTPEEYRARPQMLGRGDQQLHCPCGHVYTWFSAQEVTFRDHT